MSRGTAGVTGKGCFLGDQGRVLSLILPYHVILIGHEAFKSPPFKRSSHSCQEGSYPRTITMSCATSGWSIPEQGRLTARWHLGWERRWISRKQADWEAGL